MNRLRQRVAKMWDRLNEVLASQQIETVIRVAVVLSIVLSLGASYWVTHLQSCQTDYATRNAAALRARDVAATQDRAAMDGLVTSISLAKSAADTRAALQAYIDARARSDKVRAENPLPVPERFC